MRTLSRRALATAWSAALLIGWGASSCAVEPPLRVPEMISGKVVFSKQCNAIVYSSNKLNYFRPFTLLFSQDGTRSVIPSRIDLEQDFLARSMSHDCRFLALVADVDGRGAFDVFLYERVSQKLTNLTDSPRQDDGGPSFSPTAPLLAYLEDRSLRFYDYTSRASLAPPGPVTDFQSLTWSPSGEFLLLEGADSSIWQYDLLSSRFRKLWKADKPVYVFPSPWTDGENVYFVSDHESNFSQVYRLIPETGEVGPVLAQENDQFSPSRGSSGGLSFRVSLDGDYRLVALTREKPVPVSPPDGVVYDASLDFAPPVALYAGQEYPRSLYRVDSPDKGSLENLIPNDFKVTRSVVEPIRNQDGMNNLVFRPTGRPKGYVLWLHGGPHEEVSPRFNVYIDFMVKRGFVVFAVNYPGSTGLGNEYELRGRSLRSQLRLQRAAVERDVRQFREREGAMGRFIVIGVSYGSQLAHMYTWDEPGQVEKLVDFSGVAGRHIDAGLTAAVRMQLPPTLFIFGSNDYALLDDRRRDLLQVYEESAEVTRLEIPRAGHYIQRRDHIVTVLEALDRFLVTR